MSDKPLFENMDEQERVYAPEQVPGAVGPDAEVDQGGTAGSGTAVSTGDTAAGPVASVGTGLTGGMSTPNVGPDDDRTAPGDPNTQASYPLDHEHRTRSGDPEQNVNRLDTDRT
jgi:hypothetical protein